MSNFTESVVEKATLDWLEGLGYSVLYGPAIAPGEPATERTDPNCRDVILERRLREALVRLNPDVPAEALEDAFRKLTRIDAPSLVERNRAVHRMLVDGVTVEYRRADGSIAGAPARVLDFDVPGNNDWLAVNQFTVVEGQHNRRPDVVVFVNGEIKRRAKKNVVQSRSFAELLEKSIRAYQNRAIETMEVIEELIALAKEIRDADKRGEQLGLTEDEVAFYDALGVNDSAVKVLGDETLMTIARELVTTVRGNVTIDWTLKETVKAGLRVMVKRILRKYGYPPDKEVQATQTVLEQAEVLCADWVA